MFYFFALILLWLSWKSFRGGIEYLRFFKTEIAKPFPNFTPFCSIMAPCKGLDHQLYENLSALLTQDFPRYEVIFVLEDRDDPAHAVVEKVAREFASSATSTATTKIVFAGRSEDTAQKVHKLREGSEQISDDSEILIFVDSDAHVNSRWLRFLVAPLADESVGCATGYRWFIASHGFASQLRSVWNASIASALGANTEKNFCWGGSTAIRRKTFERLQISTRWRGTLSDDFTVTRAMNEAKLPIVFVPQCLNAQTGNCTFSEFLEFTTRQMKITRVYAPHLWRASLAGALLFSLTFWIGVVLLFILPFAGLHFFVTLFFMTAILALGFGKAYLRFRAVELVLTDHREELRKSFLSHVSLWTITPILFFYNSICALFSRKLVWRGTEYELRSPTETIILRSKTDAREMNQQNAPFEDEKPPSDEEIFEAEKKAGYYKAPLQPETQEETIRKTGLAYAAVASLVGSIVVLLIVGLLLDLYMKTSPYFLVGGIVLGSIIGFVQFFRTTQNIFRK